MLRPRIGSHPARRADAGAHGGTERRTIDPCLQVSAPLVVPEELTSAPTGVVRFVVEIALPWIERQARSIALGCMIALGGCSDGAQVEVAGIVRDGRTGEPIAHAQITTDDGRTVETDDQGRFSLAAVGELVASATGRCTARARVEPRLTLHLFDRLDVERMHAQVGFDTEVRIEVRTRCDEHAELTWSQIAGPELGDRMRTEDGGRVLVVRTHALEQLVRGLDDRPGIVALGRRERGDYRFRVALAGEGEEVAREVRVVAAPASTGVSQAVPTGADAYLNGGAGSSAHTWRLLARPRGSRAQIASPSSRVARLRPDRSGTYVVAHEPSGVSLRMHAAPYDEVARDCGQEGCHVAEYRGWARTAHASTFRRGLEGELGAHFDEPCWSCHATGVDAGIANGGLHETAARLGWNSPEPDAGLWETVPERIRREGSVWCSACHGPGHAAPADFRGQHRTMLHAGVCARCHDVAERDPDAGHLSLAVHEWRLSAMSRFARDLADDDPALRSECASCHSAQGFVDAQHGRAHEPERAMADAITCATCHDPHDATHPHSLRVFDTVGVIAGAPAEHLGSGAICASCHRSGALATQADRAAHAPQADVLLGRGARLAEPLDHGVHRFIANTCVRCHMTRPEEGDALRGRAGGHTFSIRARSGEPVVSAAACAPCHGSNVAPEAIGMRDWDGDGTHGPLAEEHARALAAIEERLRARIASLGLRDACPTSHLAVSVVEHDARIHLADAQGVLLGDCDANGSIDGNEVPVTSAALPRTLADAAHDLVMLQADGSGGVHNPAYVFRVLGALVRTL